MNYTNTNYRHGDIGLFGIDKFPDKLKESKTKTILAGGSGGHSHTINKGKLFFVSDAKVLGYLEAKDTTLFHPEHGEIIKGKRLKEAKIQDGYYQIKRQQEQTHEGMRAVID